MPYVTGQDLKRDVLFRGGESLQVANTAWDSAVMDYINRVYRTLCAGASEFLPEYIENWWWLRREGVLTILPITTIGSVDVAQGSVNITFSSAPAASVVGYRLRIEGHPEVFKIATHTAAANVATLDSPYTGPSSVAASYKLMKTDYALGASVAALVSPMKGFRDNPRIEGMSPERFDELWPTSEFQAGVPDYFSMEDEQTVRFNRGGRTDGQSMRIDYRFRPTVVDLTDSPASIPLVPLEYRYLLAEMALAYLYRDKNDQRDQSAALSAKSGLMAMVRENKHRIPKMNDHAGHIFPRGDLEAAHSRGPLRTESGLIIG